MTDKEYEDVIRFGEEVQRFCQGTIGRYLLNKAADEREAAMIDLADVDPNDTKEIIRLQTIIARSSNFGAWLKEAIEASVDCKRVLAGEEP